MSASNGRSRLGLGPGNGFPGFDDRDRVRRAVGDLGEIDPVPELGIEHGALAGESAIEGRARLGRAGAGDRERAGI